MRIADPLSRIYDGEKVSIETQNCRSRRIEAKSSRIVKNAQKKTNSLCERIWYLRGSKFNCRAEIFENEWKEHDLPHHS
ncbi:MAG: hypothetical protein QXI53_04590, partial [Archaeoglobaceae archaeon]